MYSEVLSRTVRCYRDGEVLSSTVRYKYSEVLSRTVRCFHVQ